MTIKSQNGNYVPNRKLANLMVKSVDRITRILRAIGEAKDGLTNSDLAKSLDVPKSTLSKLLTSLTSFEWLHLDAASKRYKLGPLLLFLGGRYIDHLELVQLGHHFLMQLKEEAGCVKSCLNRVLENARVPRRTALKCAPLPTKLLEGGKFYG